MTALASYASIQKDIIRKDLTGLGLLVDGWSDATILPAGFVETTTWKDGKSPLSRFVQDPRTIGPVGEVFYKTVQGDEEFKYFERKWWGDEIELCDFGIGPSCPDCSPILRNVCNYFPEGSTEVFILQSNAYHYFDTGISGIRNRAQTIKGRNGGAKPNVVVPFACVGVHIDGKNGSGGLRIEHLRISATGKEPTDRPALNGRPATGKGAGLYGFDTKYHGVHINAYTIIKDVEVVGFSGCGLKMQAYIRAGDPENSTNCNLSQIHGLKVDDCYCGILVVGSDANACDFHNCEFSNCENVAIGDYSLLGNNYTGGQTIGCHAGTYYSDGVGNASTFTNMYSEQQGGFATQADADIYGGYIGGLTTFIGGTNTLPGQGAPGSPVYTSGSATALLGRSSSGLSFGCLNIANGSFYFSNPANGNQYGSNLYINANPVPDGFNLTIGLDGTKNLGQIVSRHNPLTRSGRRVGFDVVSLDRLVISGLKQHVVATYADIAALRDDYAQLYLWKAGEPVSLLKVSPAIPHAYKCLRGGRYMADYATDIVATWAGGSGPSSYYEFQLSGTHALPEIGTSVELRSNGILYGTLEVTFIAPNSRYVGMQGPGSDYIPNVNNRTYTLTFMPPAFTPTGGMGTGLLSERPTALNLEDATWRYYAKDKGSISIWTGTSWQENSLVNGDVEITDSTKGVIMTTDGQRVRLRIGGTYNKRTLAFDELS